MLQPILRTFATRSEDLNTCRRYRYDEESDGGKTMKFQSVRRPVHARSEDLHRHRRYGYVEQNNEAKFQRVRRPFDTQSEDLHRRRRYGYVEQNDGAEMMMFQPIPSSFDARSEDFPIRRDYKYDEESDGAKTTMLQPIAKPFDARSEDLPKIKRNRYDEENDRAKLMKFQSVQRPVSARSEDLHRRRRYGYVEQNDGAKTMMLQPSRGPFDTRLEVLPTCRINRYDEEKDRAKTMKFQSVRRPVHARSEDLHTRKRYGYVEQNNEAKFQRVRRSFDTQSEDLHTRRRYGYVEQNDGAEMMMFQPLPSSFDARSEDLPIRRRYRYDEERDGAEKMMLQPIPKPFDARSEDLHTRRRYGYVEQNNGEQRRSHTILKSERLQAYKKYKDVEKDQIASRPSVKNLFWKARHFEHFHYVYLLVRDCMTRVEKLLKNNDPAYQMPEDVIVKIGIVGHHTKDNLDLLSKKPGKSKLLENEFIWSAHPLVCFENESSSKSKLKENTLCQEGVCHKIFIRSDTFCDKADRDEDEDDNSIISVCQDKDQIQDIITSCLEEPLQKMLQQWRKGLKKFWKNALDSIAEIDAISKELVLINSKDTHAPIFGSKGIVHVNVKDFLLRRSDVNSFGIWNTSVFKVFVRKSTDVKELKDELIMLNKNFFQQYHLEIEKEKTEMQNLMREDNVTGALMGFVTKTNNYQKMYAMTCYHLILRENEHACTRHLGKVVAWMLPTKTERCDFSAVEIKECYSKSCDVAFVKDHKKKINANLYSILKRATTDLKNERIVRPEFYLQATDKSNQENTFFLKGIAERGDSELLVFSRSNRIQQTYVYANNLKLYDDDKDDDAEDQNEMKSKCPKILSERGCI